MQKIMKNWIVTMVTAILLTLLAVWMTLDGAGVGDMFYTQSIIHEITAIFIGCYTVLALLPMIPRYQKVARFFALGEIVLMGLVVVVVFFKVSTAVLFAEETVLCALIGFVIWARCVVESVDAFLKNGVEGAKTVPLWKFCLYLLLAAFGVWQMAMPSIANRYLIFPIAILVLAIAAGFALATVRNRYERALAAKMAEQSAPETEEKKEETEEKKEEPEAEDKAEGKEEKEPEAK